MRSNTISDLPVRLGDWVVDKTLGAGGQAVVYRVHRKDDATQTPHVAKVLKPWDPNGKSATEDEHVGRFKREVSALESLAGTGCPNIVPVIEENLDPPKGSSPGT